ncbi:hypothetical protein GA0115242_14436 [Streptomyces sp. SolWspMP-5a-2]|nr:hypothetical protein GA0115242_14436 [Streptomyces sp. SolWspMP-5a-2]
MPLFPVRRIPSIDICRRILQRPLTGYAEVVEHTAAFAAETGVGKPMQRKLHEMLRLALAVRDADDFLLALWFLPARRRQRADPSLPGRPSYRGPRVRDPRLRSLLSDIFGSVPPAWAAVGGPTSLPALAGAASVPCEGQGDAAAAAAPDAPCRIGGTGDRTRRAGMSNTSGCLRHLVSSGGETTALAGSEALRPQRQLSRGRRTSLHEVRLHLYLPRQDTMGRGRWHASTSWSSATSACPESTGTASSTPCWHGPGPYIHA